jgi:hypothetical protein
VRLGLAVAVAADQPRVIDAEVAQVGATVDGQLSIAEIAQQGDTGAWRLRHLWL